MASRISAVAAFVLEDPAGVEQHDPPAHAREVVLDLEVVERGVLDQDGLQQVTQRGGLPLVVSQLKEQTAEGFFRLDLKRPVERPVRRFHAQAVVEHQQWLAHRGDDAVGEAARVVDGIDQGLETDDQGLVRADEQVHLAARQGLQSGLGALQP